MTAFEELKAWCEKHLDTESYKVVPQSPSYLTTIYFVENDINYICFDEDGAVHGMGTLDDDDMLDHIRDYEENA